MNKPTFYEWLKYSLAKDNSFGKFAICAYSDTGFPKGDCDYYNLQGYVWDEMKVDEKKLPFLTDVFDRMFIAYAIEHFDNYEAPLKAVQDRALKMRS